MLIGSLCLLRVHLPSVLFFSFWYGLLSSGSAIRFCNNLLLLAETKVYLVHNSRQK